MIDWNALFQKAEAARLKAYAPYSKFRVGAALATDAEIIAGCNLENASYGLTVCAERNAIAQAVLMGRKVTAVAVVVDAKQPVPPCGACRQVMAELGNPTLEIRSRTVSGQEARYTLAELLPHAFDGGFL